MCGNLLHDKSLMYELKYIPDLLLFGNISVMLEQTTLIALMYYLF